MLPASGTHRLTPEQADEMYERFGFRYHHVQTGDPYLANRAERRRGFAFSQAGYAVQLARKLDERKRRDELRHPELKKRAVSKLTAVKEATIGRLRRKAA